MINQKSSGWTALARSTFLATLAASGIVRAAAQSVHLSTQSAYALRGRDPRFARAWDSAVAIARDHLVAHLTDAAIDGWTEEIWYKGECVGERRRRNPMLAMRLLERLDRLAVKQRDNIHHFDDQLRAETVGLPIDGADVVAIHVLEERRDTAARFGQRREAARLDDAIANMAVAQPPDRCDHPDCAACDAAEDALALDPTAQIATEEDGRITDCIGWQSDADIDADIDADAEDGSPDNDRENDAEKYSGINAPLTAAVIANICAPDPADDRVFAALECQPVSTWAAFGSVTPIPQPAARSSELLSGEGHSGASVNSPVKNRQGT